MKNEFIKLGSIGIGVLSSLLICSLWFTAIEVNAQQVTQTAEQIKALTPEWKGERSADGRPLVAEKWLERLKGVSIEEAWGYLRNKGYNNQFEGEWMIIHPE